MTDDNKRNDDQDRKKLSDEEMEDVDGGVMQMPRSRRTRS